MNFFKASDPNIIFYKKWKSKLEYVFWKSQSHSGVKNILVMIRLNNMISFNKFLKRILKLIGRKYSNEYYQYEKIKSATFLQHEIIDGSKLVSQNF